MGWPLSQDYNEAVQNPTSSFADRELRGGQAVFNGAGIPMPRSGNFADVYEFIGTSGARWAVKCFTREVPRLQERYDQIDLHLLKAKLPFTVDFQYQPSGIRIHGQWYPILRMQWVEGLLLNEFVRRNLDQPTVLDRVGQVWLTMARRLRQANVAHGDLQHGNILLVRAQKGSAFKLIDYDGMWVPALANVNSGEVGHPAYQHPLRLREGTYNADVDRTSLLVVACALRCLVVGGQSLWERYDNGDNLLFCEADLKAPGKSTLFAELRELPDQRARMLVTELQVALAGTLDHVPAIDELVPEMKSSSVRVETAPPPPKSPTPDDSREFFESFSDSHEGDSPEPRGRKMWRSGIVAAGVVIVLFALLLWALWPKPPDAGFSLQAVSSQGKLSQGTRATLKIRVERTGYHGPIDVNLEGLPPGVRSPAKATMPADKNEVDLELTATADATVGDADIIVRATADLGDRQTVCSPFKLSVTGNTAPRFTLAVRPDKLMLAQGGKATFVVVVDRKGYQGPIKVKLSELPAGVRTDEARLDRGVNEVDMNLIATPTAPVAEKEITARGTALAANNVTIDSTRFLLSVTPSAKIKELFTIAFEPDRVKVEQGGKAKLKIRVERRGFQGPILLELRDLPAQVTASLARLASGMNETELELSAGVTTAIGEKKIIVRGTDSDNRTVDSAPFGLSVTPSAYTSLFNGQDLTGWKDGPLPGKWRVENGVLIGSKPAGGSLFTTRNDYRDFHLRMEARVTGKDAHLCAVLFRAQDQPIEPGGALTSAIGYQVLISPILGDNKRGTLVARNINGETVTRVTFVRGQLGEWFTLDVRAQGDRVTTQVDSLTGTMFLDEKRQYARAGHIGLLHLGNAGVEFRKIEIKELPADSPDAIREAAAAAPGGGAFVPLFNGKDLTGWKLHDKPGGNIAEVIKKEKSGRLAEYDGTLRDGREVPLWRVEDGILIGSGPASHLFSERDDYENFIFRVEAQINDKGNSGQYFRTAFGPGFPKGYETQINATHSDPVRTGSLYPAGSLAKYKSEITVMNTAPHKPNEWFTQEVTAEGNHIIIKVNGKITVDWKDPDNTYKKGHFALQGHDPGTIVKFRKIEVKELK